ncbi:MAG: bacteriocin [Trueperaceae bacterium]
MLKQLSEKELKKVTGGVMTTTFPKPPSPTNPNPKPYPELI